MRGVLPQRLDRSPSRLCALADRRRACGASRRDRRLGGKRPMARRRTLGRRRADAARDLRLGRRVRGAELSPGAEEAHQAALLHPSQGPRVAMSETKEPFLERWSRLKIKDREAASNDVPAADPAPPPAKTDEPPGPRPNLE